MTCELTEGVIIRTTTQSIFSSVVTNMVAMRFPASLAPCGIRITKNTALTMRIKKIGSTPVSCLNVTGAAGTTRITARSRWRIPSKNTSTKKKETGNRRYTCHWTARLGVWVYQYVILVAAQKLLDGVEGD